MGLFDDILKKPVNPGHPADPLGTMNASPHTNGTPAQTGPIVIERSSEETIFGTDSEAMNIAKENAPMTTPTVHADEDTSSILVSSEPEVISPLTPDILASEVVPSTTSAPLTPVSAPLPEIASAQVLPTVSPLPLINMTPTPTPSTPPSASAAPTASIFDSIMAQTPAETPSLVLTPPPESVAVSTETVAPPETKEASVYTASFSTPRAFIEQSITNIDVMLSNIDKRHDAKEAEEEGYKAEKLRFTELEKNAHQEKIIMDKERDHALHMRQILESERQRDESNRAQKDASSASVTTSLADIGEEHAISHKHSHKKSEATRNEEELLAAS